MSEIAGAIAGMARFARTREALDRAAVEGIRVAVDGTPAGGTAFRVHVPGAADDFVLPVTASIWSPELYAPMARQLLGPPTAASSAGRPEVVEALLRPRADVLQAQSVAVSSRLARNMTDVAAQEDAALIVGALGLKEWAGNFYDTRRTMCRLTAHLAMAEASRAGAPSTAGRLARATLSTLTWRQQEAVDVLDALALVDQTPPARAWSRALRMRITEDWRLEPEPEKATLLEKREFFDLAYIKQSDDRAVEFLDRIDADGLSDFGNIALSQGVNVGNGQRFMAMAGPTLMAELEGTGLSLDPKGLVVALNEEPARGPVVVTEGGSGVAVLDRGTWAAFGQRHLLNVAEKSALFYRYWLGLKDESRAMVTAMEKSFGGLRLYPLAARRFAEDRAAHAAAVAGAVALVRTRPEDVPTHHWNTIAEPPAFAFDPILAPPLEAWMKPLFPAGTYMEWPKRLWTGVGHPRVTGKDLAAMRAAVPYSSNIAVAEVRNRLRDHATPADLRREYARWVDYDTGIARIVAEASKDDPAEYRRRYETIAKVDPESLKVLGDYLAERDDDKGATEIFERYFQEGKDRVAVCNSMRWLVQADFKAGRTKRALEIAQSVAETYCGMGLWTLAELYEDMGRFDEAYVYIRKMRERYDDERALAGFLVRRWQKGDDRDPAERTAMMKKFFPDGLEAWGTDPTAPPESGVLLTETNAQAEKAKLKVGDVVVGLNGYRIRTYDQYRVLRLVDKANPVMQLVVWRNGYLHIAVDDEDRWLQIKVKAYPGPDPESNMHI